MSNSKKKKDLHNVTLAKNLSLTKLFLTILPYHQTLQRTTHNRTLARTSAGCVTPNNQNLTFVGENLQNFWKLNKYTKISCVYNFVYIMSQICSLPKLSFCCRCPMRLKQENSLPYGTKYKRTYGDKILRGCRSLTNSQKFAIITLKI